MAWCWSTRPSVFTMLILSSVAIMLSTHPCVSSCLWVNWSFPGTRRWLPSHTYFIFKSEFCRADFFNKNFTKFYSYHINTGLTHGLALNKWQVIILINDDQFCTTFLHHQTKNKQGVLMHRHQGWNVRHGLCHTYMRYVYIYELFVAFVCFIVCSLF